MKSLTNHTPRLTVLLVVLLASAFVIAGCSRRTTPGRIGIGDTTPDAMRSSEVLPVVLIEFSDEMPQRFINDMHRIPQIRDADERVVVFIGDINNKTQRVATSEFEILQRRIRANLANSDLARDKLQFVEGRARMRQLAQREGVADAGPAAYDAQNTFVMNGDFYRTSRGSENYYYLEITLTHLGSNETYPYMYESRRVRAH